MTMSTRLISCCGNMAMSAVPVTPEAGGRRPSSSTSVRVMPRFRKLAVLDVLDTEPPGVKLGVEGPVEPVSCGSWRSASVMFGAEFFRSSLPTTVIGVGA